MRLFFSSTDQFENDGYWMEEVNILDVPYDNQTSTRMEFFIFHFSFSFSDCLFLFLLLLRSSSSSLLLASSLAFRCTRPRSITLLVLMLFFRFFVDSVVVTC